MFSTRNTIPLLVHKLRSKLIIWLAGNCPVVLNMNIARPNGFRGDLIRFPKPKPIIFWNNYISNEPLDKHQSILTPRRDMPGK